MITKDKDNNQVVEFKDRILSPLFAFSLLLVPRLLAAQYAIIGDCDEGPLSFRLLTAVYNYWEPTHYLVHGSGFQTWEYSPVYAIRSWLYIALHAFVIKTCAVLGFSKVQTAKPLMPIAKLQQFYALRVFLGILSAVCETTLVQRAKAYRSPRLATSLLLLLSASAGMFVAASGTSFFCGCR
jgi:alpha-1,2-mannosyltransferase